MVLGISFNNSINIGLNNLQQKMTRARTRLSRNIPRPQFSKLLPSNLLAYTVKRMYTSDPIYPLAFANSAEDRNRLWGIQKNQDLVIKSLETIAKEGVMRHLPLDSILKRIARSLGSKEQHQFLELIHKHALIKNIPQMADKALSYFTLAEVERIIKQNIPNSKSLNQLVTDLSSFSLQTNVAEKLSFKSRAHNMIVNFIPNLIDLFVKAFSLFEMGRIETIWDITYMVSILCKVIFIPWAIICLLEPFLLEAWKVYAITGFICLIAISAIYTYLRWFKPVPHRVHYYFNNLNEEAADSQPILGRDKEVNWLSARLSAALQGGGRSVMIIGESGVGKTSIVNEFFRRVVKKEIIEENLKGLQGFGISAASLEGNANYEGFSAILKSVISRIRGYERKIPFCFTEIHAVKKNNCFLRDFLLDFLDKGKIVAICLTSKEEFNKHLSKDTEFLRRFEIYEVEPASKNMTQLILKNTAQTMASEFEFDEKALQLIYEDAQETHPKNQPSRSIDILESIINDMRQMNIHLDCVSKLEEKKALLREKKSKFEQKYAGINESEKAQSKREAITRLDNEIQADSLLVEKKQSSIKLVTSMITKQKELRVLSQKIATGMHSGRRQANTDALKKKLIQIEAYKIPQIKELVRNASQELAGDTKVKIDIATVKSYVHRESIQAKLPELIERLPHGKRLRIECDKVTHIGWRTDQGNRKFHRKSTSEQTSLDGKYYISIPTDKMPVGTRISVFTLNEEHNVFENRKHVFVV